MTSRNTKNMHLGVLNKSKEQKRERKTAKAIEKGLREHGATGEDIAMTVANARGVTSSQITQYAGGELKNDMGKLVCSQDGLEIVADYLSLNEEDEDAK